MAFEGLSEKLNAAFKRLRGKGRVTEADVKEAMKEVRLALLDADVSYSVVKDFVAKVTERAVGADVLESLTPAQQIIKIVNEELTALMGGGSEKISFASHPPTVIMMVGLQGAGKTTNGAKLAGYLRSTMGKRPLLAACDVYRPAAITLSPMPRMREAMRSGWKSSIMSSFSPVPTRSFWTPPAGSTSMSSSWTS